MTDTEVNPNLAVITEAIEDAEVVPNPVADLVERACREPAAAFAPELIAELAALKKSDRQGFEECRARLKQAACRVGEIDKLLNAELGDGGVGRSSQADALIDLAIAADLFHSPDDVSYADLEIDGHRETHPIRGKTFRRWLARRYYEATGGAPNADALQSALNVLEAKAHFDGPEQRVFLRVGTHGSRLYIDLADADWRALEIDATGWRIVDQPPVRFTQPKGVRPLPQPARGGSIRSLRSFLNVTSDDDFVLVVAWLLAALRDRGPYPLLVLSGEQGSAKSTFATIVRGLVDPNSAALRALPRDDRDIFIAAGNAHIQAFDNVSTIPAWLSDTLCRLSTGGGYATRQLHTDNEETLFTAVRPVIINGIEDVVSRDDLADRAIFLTLEPIPEDRRLAEAELWARFEAERPSILGAILDALATGLQELPRTKLDHLPRMADFALWARACESALWPAGTFDNAYRANRSRIVDDMIEADPVAAALRDLMADRDEWKGTATELLAALANVPGERRTRSGGWSDSPRAMSGRVRRCASALRHVGLNITTSRAGRQRTRVIHVTRRPASPPDKEGTRPSTPSAPSASEQSANKAAASEPSGTQTQNGRADAKSKTATPTVCSTARISWTADGADGVDANPPTPGPAAGERR